MTIDKAPATLATVKHGGCVQLVDASHPWPEVDRVLTDAYVAGNEGDEFDMIAARNALYTALSAQPSPVDMVNPISPSPGGQGDALLQAMRDARAEVFNNEPHVIATLNWLDRRAAEIAARQPVGEPVEHACTNCDRKHAEVICPTCAGIAWDNGRLHEFYEVRELSTSLGEGVLDHLLPDEWHEKPLLRFQGAYDEGDHSVGIGGRSGNVLAADQSGTVLGDYLAARAAKEGGQ